MWGSKKEKEKVFSGFMGDLSPEQELVLDQFKLWITQTETNPEGRFDDYDFLRFCRARKFVLADVQLMWTNMIEWRKKNGIDTITQNWKFDEKAQVQVIYPQFYHHTDKTGRPVYIERLGQLNVDKLWEVTTEERMFTNYFYGFETLFNHKYPACSAVAQRRIDNSFNIIDMTDFGATSLTSQVRGILSKCAAITGDNYPECLGMMICTNAPFVFSACWKIVKGFLDERTVSKIKIKGSDYPKALLEFIDADKLPKFLGGNCTCESRGGCFNSDVGPWNDFEPVYPFGIKPKGQ
jgi:hypothetical protein